MRRSLIAAVLFVLLGAVRAEAQLTNPDFDSDLTGWSKSSGTGYTVDWDGAAGDPTPGSGRIQSLTAPSSTVFPALSQCFTVAAGQTAIASAQVQADLRTGDWCSVEVYFFPCVGCFCASLDADISSTITSDSSWQMLTDAEVAPATTQTATVHLGAKLLNVPPRGHEAEILDPTVCNFDTVRVALSIFLDDFETGDSCEWTDTVGTGDLCP
jgi:hypothetical protein